MTELQTGPGAAVSESASWLASYGPKPPAGMQATLVGSGEGSQKLYLSARPGHLPAVSEGPHFSVVFSGRLDAPSTASDADVVRDAYLRKGEAGLRDLRGSFVLLIVERDGLIAARDALGYHPLFVAEQDGCVLMAPSQELLFAAGVPAEVDRAVVAAWLCTQSVDRHETFFSTIGRLLPGHCLRVSPAGVSEHRYWNPATAQSTQAASFESVHEEFERILRRSVARCLGQGQAGILLSGGIDSAVVAAVATEVSREQGLPDPLALSLRLADAESDESAVQRAVAHELGISQVMATFDEVFGEEGGVVETLRMTAEVTTPPGAPWTAAYDHLSSQAVARGCDVMLTGVWGEWLFVEEPVAADLLRRLDLGGLYALCRAEHDYYGWPWRKTVHRLAWKRGLRLLLRQPAAVAIERLGGNRVIEELRTHRLLNLMPDWVAPSPDLRGECAKRWAGVLPKPGWKDFYGRALSDALDWSDTIVWMDDGLDHPRRFGIESLEPFHDRGLLEFLFSIPPKHLFFGGRVKALLWESIRSRIPKTAIRLGVSSQERLFESMLVGDGARGLEFVEGFPVLSDLQLIAPDAPVRALRSGVFSERVKLQHAWRALAMEAWLQSRLTSG